MFLKKQKIFAILLIVIVAGCAGGPKETGGTYIGALAGGFLGSQFDNSGWLGAALGALIGSQLGASVGKHLDEQDKTLVAQTTYQALEYSPDNRAVAWHNPNNNHKGNVVVSNTAEHNNKVCRDYVHSVVIDGKTEQVHGRACRDVRDPKAQWIDNKL